ncbi:23S rRNA (uracil-C(5))-methyltransferase RlmCD [bacterium HR34]|nr:23S rRNA (uracil-C(5))-methyltransferase RlmCD [bacterium HR34]
MEKLILTFKDFVYPGKVEAFLDGKKYFGIGVLPGEKAEVLVVKKEKNGYNVLPLKILKKSKLRKRPFESHFLSCSPFQIIPYDSQVKIKSKLIIDEFSKELNNYLKGGVIFNKIFTQKRTTGYRTKMEFSFAEQKGKIFLSFFKRYSYKEKIILKTGCKLASKNLNLKALELVEFLNKEQINPDILKSLICRESKTTKEIISILFLKDKSQKIEKIFRKLKNENLIVVFSDPKSPASKINEILYKSGKDYLIENIFCIQLKYGFDNFFQNNIEMLKVALKIIKSEIPSGKFVFDLFCGVGTLGLSVAKKSKKVIGVEVDKKAIEFAKLNAKENKIYNFDGIVEDVSKLDFKMLEKLEVVILDPPRAGLQEKLCLKLLKHLPEKIIYLSCNPKTQIEDLKILLQKYKLKKLYYFDFYPHTLHSETLAILEPN